MAKWDGFQGALSEVERLRVELEQARAERDLFRDSVARQSGARVMAERRALAAEQAAEQAKAERDDLAARLQAVQQAKRRIDPQPTKGQAE